MVGVIENPEETTAADRVNRWEGAVQVFEEHPILGAGFGVGDLEAGLKAAGRESPAHSDYLRVLADTGVLGLVAYAWLLIATGLAVLTAYRRSTSSLGRSVALAFLAVWLGFIVLRISGNILTIQVVQYYYWTLAALAIGLSMRSSEPDPAGITPGTGTENDAAGGSRT